MCSRAVPPRPPRAARRGAVWRRPRAFRGAVARARVGAARNARLARAPESRRDEAAAAHRLGRRARGGGGGGQRALEGLGVRDREGARQDTRPVAQPSTISSPTAARPAAESPVAARTAAARPAAARPADFSERPAARAVAAPSPASKGWSLRGDAICAPSRGLALPLDAQPSAAAAVAAPPLQSCGDKLQSTASQGRRRCQRESNEPGRLRDGPPTRRRQIVRGHNSACRGSSSVRQSEYMHLTLMTSH